MILKRTLCLVLAALCVMSVTLTALAVEVDCDSSYCFSADDFAADEPLTGVCITGLPDSKAGTVCWAAVWCGTGIF